MFGISSINSMGQNNKWIRAIATRVQDQSLIKLWCCDPLQVPPERMIFEKQCQWGEAGGMEWISWTIVDVCQFLPIETWWGEGGYYMDTVLVEQAKNRCIYCSEPLCAKWNICLRTPVWIFFLLFFFIIIIPLSSWSWLWLCVPWFSFFWFYSHNRYLSHVFVIIHTTRLSCFLHGRLASLTGTKTSVSTVSWTFWRPSFKKRVWKGTIQDGMGWAISGLVSIVCFSSWNFWEDGFFQLGWKQPPTWGKGRCK